MDKESPLENGLVKFVEDHSETFTDVASIRRSIIRAFATFQFHQQYSGILRAGQQHYSPPGLKHLAQVILNAIVDKMERYSKTSQDIRDILNKFDLCVEFIQIFINVKDGDGLCAYETISGGQVSVVQQCINFMNSLVIPPRHIGVWLDIPRPTHEIWKLAANHINYYHSRVLKLWAEILIGMNEIKNDVIEQMKQRMSSPAAQEAIVSTFGNPANMNLKTLLNVLTFIHLTSYHDQMDLFSKNGDGLLVNRFVELNNTHSIGNSFIGPPISSKLNDELQLKCNVIGNADSSLPVQAYLSSDVLDRCVKSIGGFPTTRQFVEFLNMVRQSKAEQFLKKDSDLSTVTTTSSFGGGKKTIHKIKKRNKKSNKKRSQRSHYR
jgi:hypothetical protein